MCDSVCLCVCVGLCCNPNIALFVEKHNENVPFVRIICYRSQQIAEQVEAHRSAGSTNNNNKKWTVTLGTTSYQLQRTGYSLLLSTASLTGQSLFFLVKGVG